VHRLAGITVLERKGDNRGGASVGALSSVRKTLSGLATWLRPIEKDSRPAPIIRVHSWLHVSFVVASQGSVTSYAIIDALKGVAYN